MIVGPGGENIYPEDIETVLNSHVYIADSIVTEQQGRLVALVHFNRDEIESDDRRLARGVGPPRKRRWRPRPNSLKKRFWIS